MGNYELMVLLAPSVDNSAKDEVVKLISDYTRSVDGKLISTQELGKKELAYSIKKQNEALYHLFYLSMPPVSINELNKKILLNEIIIRHLIVKKEKEKITKPKEEKTKELKAKKELEVKIKSASKTRKSKTVKKTEAKVKKTSKK